MKKGEMGCSMSHVLLYKKLLRDDYLDKYLIMEDDAELNVSFNCPPQFLHDSSGMFVSEGSFVILNIRLW